MDFERMNEIQICTTGQPYARTGFTTILAGPEHPNFGAFTQASGHHIGFNDLKTIEVAEFLEAIAGGERRGPDFREAWEIQKIIDSDRASFVKFAHALHDAGMQALTAIDARNVEGLLNAGEVIDTACENCHLKYWYPDSEQANEAKKISGFSWPASRNDRTSPACS